MVKKETNQTYSNQAKEKEKLHQELMGLMAIAHGEVQDAAREIETALDRLIQKENQHNRDVFIRVVQEAMVIPKSLNFNKLDEGIKKALIDILEHAQEFIKNGLQDYIAFNEKIKQEKKNLKERIEKIEAERKMFRP